MSDYKYKIGITQGDTNGIGWEVIIKALSHPSVVELFTPVVYGARHIAEHYMHKLEDVEPLQFFYCNSAAEARRGRINLVECGADTDKLLSCHGKQTGLLHQISRRGCQNLRRKQHSFVCNAANKFSSSAIFT